MRLVDAGLGVTLLPQMGAACLSDGARVRSRLVPGEDAECPIALAWRAGHPRAEAFRLLGATIREAVSHAPIAASA